MSRRRRPRLRPRSRFYTGPGFHFYAEPDQACEFCLSREIRWQFCTNPFFLPEEGALPEYRDDGEWAACDDCRELIENEEWDALLRKAIAGQLIEHASHPELGPLDTAVATAWRMRMYGAFRANLLGPAVPFARQEHRGE